MSKKYLILIAIFLIILTLGAIRLFSGSEDTWFCQNGQWAKHGNPSSPMPAKICPGGSAVLPQVFTTVKGNSDIIRLTKPLPEKIFTPLELEGEARGNWYFEASFPVKILDLKGQEIAGGIAQAQGNWMTEGYVPFKAKIDFLASEDTNAVLILKKDNPSGLSANDDELDIPVRLAASDVMAVKVFFNNSKLDPEFSCNKVFPVDRAIALTQAPAKAALELLLAGNLTDEEKSDGFGTSINPNVKIQGLSIENSVARVDFNEQLEYQVGGSCRVAAIRAQITQTLMQFPTVNEVIISINGRTEDILQP